MQQTSMTDATRKLSGLVDRVAFGRDRIVLTRNNKPVAVLVPMADLDKLNPGGRRHQVKESQE